MFGKGKRREKRSGRLKTREAVTWFTALVKHVVPSVASYVSISREDL
jgi:hypothetical protein